MSKELPPQTPAAPPAAATATAPPAKPAPPPISFGRLPGESAKAYGALRVYLRLGADRSIVKAGRKLGKNRVTLEDWSVKFHWVERAKAFDDDVAQNEQAALADEQRRRAQEWADREQNHRERRFRLGERLLSKAEEILNMPTKRQTRKKGKIIIEPLNVTLHQAARLSDVGDKLIGLATGLSTENTQITTPDGSPIITAPAGTVHIYLPEKKKLPEEPAAPPSTAAKG